ncbi:MAG TPA: HDOD domain-containing protein [Myxococcota bacterium]|nr:HDOD domain-containing protein [Myxococcota bacterium]
MGIGELRDLARQGREGAEALALAVEQVPGWSDAVLEVANRAARYGAGPFKSVDRAVIVLGARAVVEIALAVRPAE